MTRTPPSAASAEGGCRCGRVRLRVTGRPLLTFACHCTGCQRMSASAFSLSSCYSDDRFEILRGAPVIGGLHGATRHFHCPHCLSWLFTRPEGRDSFVNLRTTMLDDVPAAPPFLEAFTREALPWAHTGATHSFATVPPDDAYDALIAEFARGAGPG